MEDQIQKEKIHLENVKNAIEKELKLDNEMIVKIPYEYKGRYADIKWGDEDLVEELSNMYQHRINVLTGLDKKPYFGSFVFENQSGYSKNFRIGKVNISNDNKEQLVVDWRSPICSIYYDESVGPVSYEAPKGTISGKLLGKTQILIEDGQLISLQNVDLVSNDELLQPYLNVNADNRMKIIIASIQSEQNKIIRKPCNKDLIIQGVAGSGKTSVALHRIAYLLYDDEDKTDSSDFAIIGPNKYFLKYISSILPDLDTKEVKNFTFEDLARNIINEKTYKIINASDEINDYIHDEKDGEIKKIKGSLKYCKMINSFIKDYFEENLKGDIVFNGITIIEEENYKDRLNYSNGYINAVNTFVVKLIAKSKEKCSDQKMLFLGTLLEADGNSEPGSIEREEIRNNINELQKKIKNGFSSEIKNKFKPLLISPINLYKLFLENIEKYSEDTDINIINRLKTSTLNSLKKKNIPYEDLASLMYITKLSTNQNEYKKYRQIVVDEAQDYSIFQFLAIKEWFSTANFSIFGDLAQTLCPYRSIDNWEEVINNIFNGKVELLRLNKSYRTTKQITENANNVLNSLNLENAQPVIREGSIVSFIKQNNNFNYNYLINKELEKGYKSIGIICKDNTELISVSKELEKEKINFNIVNNQNTEYYGGISLLTSFSAKGLEFDSVIITDASNEKYKINDNLDMHLLYVACTRALHNLTIKYNNELCSVFS